ncbi:MULTISPECIES: response regulator [Pseudomonas]|uniref:response regulator n=1 Tax=Pseudomonas TaxID=286 RepID=UPI001E634EA2|nr:MULTISPECIES: response regulator [Pseudomonas]UHC80803.1 response regulator [Pseudomonas sp. NIBR-H-19]
MRFGIFPNQYYAETPDTCANSTILEATIMSLQPLRILVLEDHAFQRSVAVSILQSLGCRQIYEASDGAQALALLKDIGCVDIALCDLQMEGMDGLQFLQRVGASGQVKSVIISSSLSADLRRELLALGCTQGQGYWYARPMAGTDLLNWLQRRSYRQISGE